jgi:hypothetical protein
MSIAWGSLVLLVVLLPGFLFFVRQLLSERFTRETEQRSPLGQLAGALSVAFLVHAIWYLLLTWSCGHIGPCVSIRAFLLTVNLDPKFPEQIAAVDSMINRYRLAITSYVIVTSITGVAAGYGFASLVAHFSIRGFTKHPWVGKLRDDGFTYAWVLTKIKTKEDKHLMYGGFLSALGLQQNGKFSYLVIRDAVRLYLELGEDVVKTSRDELRLPIGVGTPERLADGKRRVESYFVIEGEDVANVVFDILAPGTIPVSNDELLTTLKQVADELHMPITEQQLADLKKISPDKRPLIAGLRNWPQEKSSKRKRSED